MSPSLTTITILLLVLLTTHTNAHSNDITPDGYFDVLALFMVVTGHCLVWEADTHSSTGHTTADSGVHMYELACGTGDEIKVRKYANAANCGGSSTEDIYDSTDPEWGLKYTGSCTSVTGGHAVVRFGNDVTDTTDTCQWADDKYSEMAILTDQCVQGVQSSRYRYTDCIAEDTSQSINGQVDYRDYDDSGCTTGQAHELTFENTVSSCSPPNDDVFQTPNVFSNFGSINYEGLYVYECYPCAKTGACMRVDEGENGITASTMAVRSAMLLSLVSFVLFSFM